MTSDASYNTSRGELQVRSDWISKLGDCVERVVLHIDKDARELALTSANSNTMLLSRKLSGRGGYSRLNAGVTSVREVFDENTSFKIEHKNKMLILKEVK